MKKKLLMLPCIAAVAIISGYGGMKTYLSQAKNSYELLAQNVEALSMGEDDTSNLSECTGLSLYDEVGIAYSEKTVRSHKPDNSNYDYVDVYAIRFCYAEGIGKSNGCNSNISMTIKERKEEKCLGDLYHNSLY